VVNVPLLEDGRCAATFNVLGTRARWTPQEIALVRLLALLATPWVRDRLYNEPPSWLARARRAARSENRGASE
jgi:GAF domain-containing protein